MDFQNATRSGEDLMKKDDQMENKCRQTAADTLAQDDQRELQARLSGQRGPVGSSVPTLRTVIPKPVRPTSPVRAPVRTAVSDRPPVSALPLQSTSDSTARQHLSAHDAAQSV